MIFQTEIKISKNNVELKVCHRLDKETSGALVFARSKESAAQLTELFSQHQVEKEYWFISHKKSEKEEWVCEEPIRKGGQSEAPMERDVGSVAVTKFQRVGVGTSLYLYKAYPKTGKTHQIRIHATQSGVPILGDETYGGKGFPRLMLHSHRLKFELNGQKYEFKSPASSLFDSLEDCSDPQLSSWIVHFERRQLLFLESLKSDQCLRLLHSETGDLRMDKAGDVYVLGWWKDEAPSNKEIEKIKSFLKRQGIEKWIFQWRPRKTDPNLDILLKSENFPEPWEFAENGVKFLGSMERGHNFGLFLDQRVRRQWVRDHSKDKEVLNLFSFTCGFSSYAALGGAQRVVSVDTSKKYLNWGRENFELNGLKSSDYEFRAMDSIEYLSYAKKKSQSFDIIICDPPSFSRHKKKKATFKIERDGDHLIQACSAVLKPGGTLLFSTNFETRSYEKWKNFLEENYKSWDFTEVSSSESQWDYEWQKQGANLKAFFLKKS
ncbi:MAG: class I SAM-dependent methyltransferase [Bdellovibrionales bacterium]|nr:class I SAM-dependent methyltransferase [Bdellovibrionales bacterium]NQZ19694.1 class I SAM-dependent methyltransferase [Bdellovibrionales bacterium]